MCGSFFQVGASADLVLPRLHPEAQDTAPDSLRPSSPPSCRMRVHDPLRQPWSNTPGCEASTVTGTQ